MRSALLAVAAFAAGLVYLAWPAFSSGFARLPGDLGDARLLNIIAEHWYLVARGASSWRNLEMFHPQAGVLGHTDALILFAPPYIALRVVGLAPAYAYFGTLVFVLGIGYAGTLWLLRRVVGVSIPVAIVGALLFAFSNINVLKFGHSQLYAAAFVPIVVGLLWRTAAGLAAGRSFLRTGVALAILSPLLLYTSFYVGWYMLLFAATWALLLLVVTGWLAPSTLRGFLFQVNAQRGWLLALAALFVVALAPFLVTYLPALRDAGARVWDEVRLSLPAVVDLANVGTDNMAWGWLVRAVVPAERPLAHELWLGMPLLLLVLFAIAMASLARHAVRARGKASTQAPRDLAIVALGGTVIGSWLLMIEVDGLSLWELVFRLVPGGAAVRAVFRYQVVLHLAVIVVVAAGIDRALRQRRLRVFAAIVMGCLLLEQLTTYRVSFDAAEAGRRLAALSSPPAGCRFFLVERERTIAGRPAFHAQLEAAVIAQQTGLPTLNGYSTHLPAGWAPALENVQGPGYAEAALAWMAKNNLRGGLCLVDLETLTWRIPAARMVGLHGDNLIRRDIRTVDDAMAVALRGFHPPEPAGRWTTGVGEILFAAPVHIRGLRVVGSVWNAGSRVRIALDGRTVFDEALGAGPFSIDLFTSGTVSAIAIASPSFVPRAAGMNDDARQLGVMIESVEIR